MFFFPPFYAWMCLPLTFSPDGQQQRTDLIKSLTQVHTYNLGSAFMRDFLIKQAIKININKHISRYRRHPRAAERTSSFKLLYLSHL